MAVQSKQLHLTEMGIKGQMLGNHMKYVVLSCPWLLLPPICVFKNGIYADCLMLAVWICYPEKHLDF